MAEEEMETMGGAKRQTQDIAGLEEARYRYEATREAREAQFLVSHAPGNGTAETRRDGSAFWKVPDKL